MTEAAALQRLLRFRGLGCGRCQPPAAFVLDVRGRRAAPMASAWGGTHGCAVLPPPTGTG